MLIHVTRPTIPSTAISLRLLEGPDGVLRSGSEDAVDGSRIVAERLQSLLKISHRWLGRAFPQNGFGHGDDPPRGGPDRRRYPDSMPLTSARQVTGPTIPSTATDGTSSDKACWNPRTAASVRGPKTPST